MSREQEIEKLAFDLDGFHQVMQGIYDMKDLAGVVIDAGYRLPPEPVAEGKLKCCDVVTLPSNIGDYEVCSSCGKKIDKVELPLLTDDRRERGIDLNVKYSRWQRFMVWLNGRAELGYRFTSGECFPRKLYMAKCRKHGYFEDTLHGFEGHEHFDCPVCLRERAG